MSNTDVDMDARNDEKINKMLQRIKDNVERIYVESLYKNADLVLDEMRSRCPKGESLALVNSLGKEMIKKGSSATVIVGSIVESINPHPYKSGGTDARDYAKYVEFGRNKQPFIYRTYTATRDDFKTAVMSDLGKAVRND